MTHRYFDGFTVTSTAGVFTSYIMSANGMYDPNITGTGGQPTYFDQVGSIYDHYTVMKSTVEFTFLVDKPCLVYSWIDDDTTAVSNVDAAAQTTSVVRLVTNLNTKPTVIRHSWNAKQYFGGDILDNDNLQGSTAANPSEQSYYCIGCRTQDGSNVIMTVTATLYFTAVWDELKTIPAS
jgi:hypothetical protein